MAFCTNCGSEVAGQFCPKCGTKIGSGASPVGTPPTAPAGSGLTPNLASALAYIPIVGIIFLLIEPYNKNREVRFHCFQSIFLFVPYVILRAIIPELYFALRSLTYLISSLVGFAFLIAIIYCGYNAYNGKKIVLPTIGALAEKQA
jgi:uncharacterized membrane protein